MKNKLLSSISYGMLGSILLFTIVSCSKPVSDLDQIKAFKPDNKYFKSSLVSLHFMTEVMSIDKVESAYKQMYSAFDLPTTAEGVPDGVYSAESPLDAFDYKHVINIEVKDGKITSVDYNEVKLNGIGKQEDETYCEEMIISGTSPAIAYPIMEKQLLKTQNSLDIDAVSGATYSLYRMRFALSIALIKAKLQAEI